MPRTDTFLLLSGDYAQRLDALGAEFDKAVEKAQTSRRLTDPTWVEQVRADYEALKAEAEAAGTRIVLEAIGRKTWRDLKAKHPPRTEGDPELIKGDRLAGVNTDSVEDDLVYASLTEPAFGSRDAYEEWADRLSEGEFQTILVRAWTLVNVSRVDPKSLPSLPTPSNDAN